MSKEPGALQLFEYFNVLGELPSGVLIHTHDIFTPRDYPEHWILESQLLWNEQYLLEAFLSYNSKFEVLAASYGQKLVTA